IAPPSHTVRPSAQTPGIPVSQASPAPGSPLSGTPSQSSSSPLQSSSSGTQPVPEPPSGSGPSSGPESPEALPLITPVSPSPVSPDSALALALAAWVIDPLEPNPVRPPPESPTAQPLASSPARDGTASGTPNRPRTQDMGRAYQDRRAAGPPSARARAARWTHYAVTFLPWHFL